MLSRSDLAAIFRKIADDIEKVEAKPEPAPAPVIDLDTVKGVQQALNKLTENLPKIEEDGVHGPEMAYLVKIFQTSAGLPATGEADEATVNAIHKLLFGR